MNQKYIHIILIIILFCFAKISYSQNTNRDFVFVRINNKLHLPKNDLLNNNSKYIKTLDYKHNELSFELFFNNANKQAKFRVRSSTYLMRLTHFWATHVKLHSCFSNGFNHKVKVNLCRTLRNFVLNFVKLCG